MRSRRVLPAVVALALTVSSGARAQDFDPRGHRASGPTPQRAPARAVRPAAPAPGVPSQEVLIDRYTHVVLAQPGAPFPLQRLTQLYRERDGGIAKLVVDFESRASQAGPEQYAATVSLAGLYKLDGREADAVATYEKAVRIRATDANAILALAHLLQDRGDLGSARARYEQGLALESKQPDKEQTLRTLRTIALAEKDWNAAKSYHRALVGLEPASLFVMGELGRELYDLGEYERAEVELNDVVSAAAGDNRALAPALRELGRAQARAQEPDRALATLRRALVAAGAQGALRAQIYEVIAEVYRANQRLPALLKELEEEHPSDFARLAFLGGLYEETGDSGKAIETYKRALAADPHQLDLRVRVIRLLQANGDLDKAIVEYEALIRAAPNNPQFVFEECDALLQRGDRARALKLASDLETRAANDEEVLARLADFYARIGDGARSLRVLQRLAETTNGDSGHLVDLGDRYFQDGNAALAIETWKRILAVTSPRAKALCALGDVYLEHDMTADALAAYKEAVQLDRGNLSYKKALAAAYERTRAYREASALYEEILAGARDKGDKALLRECRTRIVTLWGLERVLEQQLPALRRQFGATPPDLESGRTLAEAQLHLRRLGEAEATLRRVIEVAPGDGEGYLALERVLVQEGKIADAVLVLEKLAEAEPKRARELYERMAQYALQIYRDDDAIKYAARALALNPEDAEGHRRLGEMYRSKQDVARAIVEFRAAIAKNDRLFPVYFELADLLLSTGQLDEADRLFRRVVRGAPDEELIARAARLSMQTNIGRGSLELLERDLLPLAIGNTQRPIYRRLLVEIYGSLTFGLVQRVRHGTPEDAASARGALALVGARAIKPLLDALADQDVGQQRIAVDVLSYVENRNAALPLFAYATGAAELGLRARAMVACGALGDASLIPKYQALLYPGGAGGDQAALADSVGVAAVWGLARIRNPRAQPLLRRVARGGTPAMRALAALGLGMSGDKASIADVAAMATSVDGGTVASAAAAYALGDLDAWGQVPALLEIAEDGEPLARRMALMALAHMVVSSNKEPTWEGDAVQAMADAVFPDEQDGPRGKADAEALARTGLTALATLAARGEPSTSALGPGRDSRPRADRKGSKTLPMPQGALDVEALLDGLVPQDMTAALREGALVRYADPILRSALAALRTSGDRARVVLDALGTGDGELAPFVGHGEVGEAATKARTIFLALEPSIVPLARHPDPLMRIKAVVLVARSSSDDALEAVAAALEDPNESVQRVALAAVASPRAEGGPVRAGERAMRAVARILSTNDNWAIRVLAARAMGRLGAAGASPEAGSHLVRVATGDAYALVRQAALESLAFFDRPRARSLAASVATSDPEPRVRETARALEDDLSKR